MAESRTEGVLAELLEAQWWSTKRRTADRLVIEQEYKDYRGLEVTFRSKTGPGDGLPEGVLIDINSGEPVAVIEAKASEGDIGRALDEAQFYAETCIDNGYSPIAIGIAGDEDSFTVRVSRWSGTAWRSVEYDGNPIGWIPSPDGVATVRASTGPVADLRPTPPSVAVLAARADEINRLLRESKLKDEYRPGVVAAIMLGLWQSRGRIRRDADHILGDINGACADAFAAAGKPELARSLRVDEANALLAVRARRICQILESLNVTVLSAEHDYLGQLYETFFRYTGGNTIGQYFTPRHVTRFAADLTQTGSADITLDPAVGTGGFLIAAMERCIRVEGLSREAVVALVRTRLVGFESEPVTAALCVANMILRGDGTTGIYPEDCFTSPHFPAGDELATVALMNPPFPHRQTDTPPERFVERALQGLQRHGRLAFIAPSSLLSKASKKQWRERMLAGNTLRAVISLPNELFQPYASATTALVVMEKGVANDGASFFARVTNDGLRLKKGVRVPIEGNQLPSIERAYLQHEMVPGVAALARASSSGWSPGAYLPLSAHPIADIEREVDILVRAKTSFVVHYAPELARIQAEVRAHSVNPLPYSALVGRRRPIAPGAAGTIGHYFDIYYGQKELHSKEQLVPGSTLIISSSGADNGCYGFFDFTKVLAPPFVTVPSTGSIGEARVQEHPCGVVDDCLVLIPRDGTPRALNYIAAATLRLERWRFDYGRKITPERIRDFPVVMDAALNARLDSLLADASAVEEVAMERFSSRTATTGLGEADAAVTEIAAQDNGAAESD